MATIALIWELGSDYGHIGRFLPIAQALRAGGHRPVLILRDISRADEMLGPYGLEYLQAPLWLPPISGLPPPINFTESLFLFGFFTPPGLLSIARAWRQLFSLLKPDLLVFDHAPTALLAARGLAIPRLITGNSFAVLPRQAPLPVYRWWDPSGSFQTRMCDTEARLKDNANFVLDSLGAPPLKRVGDLYDAEATLITGTKELDVYGPRTAESYIGAINSISHGVEPCWPGNRTTRIFAYLKPHYVHFDQLLSALSRIDASVLIFAPGAAKQQVLRHQTPNLVFSDQPLLMTQVREQCHVAVCHAGGTVDVMLQAGTPLLLLPIQMEQTMTSMRVQRTGCGLAFLPDQRPSTFDKLLRQLLGSSDFANRARAYAENHRSYSQERALTHFIGTCHELLATNPSPAMNLSGMS